MTEKRQDFNDGGYAISLFVITPCEEDVHLFRDLSVEMMRKFQENSKGASTAELKAQYMEKTAVQALFLMTDIARTQHMMRGGTVETFDERSQKNLEIVTEEIRKHLHPEK